MIRLRRGGHVAVGAVTVVARRQQQKVAALALVATCDADVHDLVLPEVHEAAEQTRRRLDDDGAVALEVDRAQAVDRLAVAGEQERLGVHQALPQHDLIRRCGSPFRDATPHVIPGDAVQLREVYLDGAIEVQRLPQPHRGIAHRIAVPELELAGAGPDLFRAEPAVDHVCVFGVSTRSRLPRCPAAPRSSRRTPSPGRRGETALRIAPPALVGTQLDSLPAGAVGAK